MATLDSLKDALRDTLTDQGVLQKMRAEMRAEVFKCLRDPDETPPPLPHEATIVNELIREYLEYQNWKHTLSVLGPESGSTELNDSTPKMRQLLAQELNLSTDREVPLLFQLVQNARQQTPSQQ
eukprot:TRINITY_DN14360_c0_g1_i1.p1 TRINITY_DN14360_c0_g1~~TRINITY_DN14360_c0_g1_i1.p1  ORF type:complete len:124 (+),score=45.98 TRINITY_DN14360_c0_g1_i1:113-484(+)